MGGRECGERGKEEEGGEGDKEEATFLVTVAVVDIVASRVEGGCNLTDDAFVLSNRERLRAIASSATAGVVKSMVTTRRAALLSEATVLASRAFPL